MLENGFRNQNKKGEWFEVIGYAKGRYDVKFDNGMIRTNTTKQRVLDGTVTSNKPRGGLIVNIGDKFGKLIVTESDYPKDPVLVCECGNTYTTARYNLLNNLKTSCGCSPMKPATDAYWSDFNRWMKDWNPNTHKISVKKLPLFSFKKGSTKFEKVSGFTYVDAEFYDYWKQFPFIRVGLGYACLVNNAYVYDKILGFGRNLKYTYKLHHLVRGHSNYGDTVVDHINGCKLDNRFKNLRTVTTQQNAYNTRKLNTKQTSSIYKGVCFTPWKTKLKNGKWKTWRAMITWNNSKNSRVVYCETEIEAALKYNELATEIFGEFAKLNVIKAP